MRVLFFALGLLLPLAAQAADGCGPRGYRDSHGVCTQVPHRVAAICRDGFVSYSRHRGVCTRHGGVWYRGHPN